MTKKAIIILGAVLVFLACFYSRAWYRSVMRSSRLEAAYSLRTADNKYTFINPLLGCEVARENSGSEVIQMKSNIQELLAEMKKKGSIESVGLYYRDLNTGRWFGINHDLAFSPASLFKVPILIAYLRMGEINPSILQKSIQLQKVELPYAQQISPQQKIEVGSWYRVEKLLEYMIKYSDNNALEALVSNINSEPYIREILSDLGLSFEQATNPKSPSFMTPKTNSLLFRILRNGTYLTRSNSEKALKMLSETEYRNGIVKGVPQGITVSHKFGERFVESPGKTHHEFHDCGIVYYPQRPYLLCIMTSGSSQDDLEQSIQVISKQIYDFKEKNKE